MKEILLIYFLFSEAEFWNAEALHHLASLINCFEHSLNQSGPRGFPKLCSGALFPQHTCPMLWLVSAGLYEACEPLPCKNEQCKS